MSGDCISNSQNSNEIRKEVKNGKDHDAFSLLRKQRLDYPKNVIFGHLTLICIKWILGDPWNICLVTRFN